MNKSIRHTFFVYMTFILLTSITILGSLQIYFTSSYFREEKTQTLNKIINIVEQGALDGRHILTDENRHLINSISSLSSATIILTDAEGQIYHSSGDIAQGPMLIDASIMQKLIETGNYYEQGRLGGIFKSTYHTVARTIYNAEGLLLGSVFASANTEGTQVFLTSLMSGFMFSATVVMLLASFLALVLARVITVPIYHLNTAAQQFGEGNYTVRVPVSGNNELTRLAITFNEMASSFETTDQSRRNFMGNIAHELRTPMTTIKGFIDGMLDGTIPKEEHSRYLAVVSEEVGRLARLTQNMLDVSKLEVGEYVPENSSFDIWSSANSVFIAAVQRINDKKIEVSGLEENKPAYVVADKDFVHQILFNLVDNAIKFTPEGGSIRVFASSSRSTVTFCIFNSGKGVAAESLPYIFDRFYKTDQSRGVNTKGSGLGLHLCKVLLGLMGGRIWAENKSGGGINFCFTLPAGNAKKPGGRGAQ